MQGVILCMSPANERRRYNVTSSLVGWAHSIKSLSMGTRSSNEFQWLDLKIGCQDNSSNNGYQGDMLYYVRLLSCAWSSAINLNMNFHHVNNNEQNSEKITIEDSVIANCLMLVGTKACDAKMSCYLWCLLLSSLWMISVFKWFRSRRCISLVTWFCYQFIAKPGNKTAASSHLRDLTHIQYVRSK